MRRHWRAPRRKPHRTWVQNVGQRALPTKDERAAACVDPASAAPGRRHRWLVCARTAIARHGPMLSCGQQHRDAKPKSPGDWPRCAAATRVGAGAGVRGCSDDNGAQRRTSQRGVVGVLQEQRGFRRRRVAREREHRGRRALRPAGRASERHHPRKEHVRRVLPAHRAHPAALLPPAAAASGFLVAFLSSVRRR